MVETEELQLVKLTADHEIKPFDCGNPDLNDFLVNDAKGYDRHLISVTYLLESNGKTVAFFSVCNDKVTTDDTTKTVLNRFKRKLPRSKHRGDYPAVKIGRLAVSKEYCGKGHGRRMLNYVKHLFITNNRTGCRFITVDAYARARTFYEDNKFEYFQPADKLKKIPDTDTVLMYFDLQTLQEQSDQTQ